MKKVNSKRPRTITVVRVARPYPDLRVPGLYWCHRCQTVHVHG